MLECLLKWKYVGNYCHCKSWILDFKGEETILHNKSFHDLQARTAPLITTSSEIRKEAALFIGVAEDRRSSVLSFQLLGGQYAPIFCRFVLFLQSMVRIEKDDVMIF